MPGKIQENCEHLDIDDKHRMCIDCGKDFVPDEIAKAFDEWKDKRKYGE